MPVHEHITNFAGRPVKDWEPQSGIQDPEGACYALRLSYEEGEEGLRWTDKFAAFLDDPFSSRVSGIVIGDWGLLSAAMDQTSAFVVEALVAARDRLPNLRAIFLGDIVGEECEISWVRQSDISPLFVAYPQLEHFCVRGAEGLSLGALTHDRLKSLIIQSGGLDANVVREVAAAKLPELEHLELWLGDDSYGGNATVSDLAPILEGKLFPKLKYLGLRDSEIADEIARHNGELRLYNSRRIRVYRDWREIAELIDALCRHQVHVEQWLPKAGFDNRTFDLRVVVIAGRACHTVARLSRSPMTNLHLLNERGDPDAVREKIGQAAWDAAMRNCERAMECFPASLYAGIDLLFTPDYRRQAVIEVNAFGDLLPDVFWRGRDTYTSELVAMGELEWSLTRED